MTSIAPTNDANISEDAYLVRNAMTLALERLRALSLDAANRATIESVGMHVSPDPYAGVTDDAAALLTREPADARPPVVLSGAEAARIAEALRQADIALEGACASKLRTIRAPAREARIKVQAAWGILCRGPMP